MGDTPTILDLWDFNYPDLSEERFREWMGKTDPADPYHHELKTQLARTLSLRSRFDEAHALLDEINRDLAPTVNVRYLLERGRSFNSSKQQDKAMSLFIEAWHAAEKAGLDGLAVDALHMVAIAEPDPQKTIEWHAKTLAYIDGSDQRDAKRWAGSVYNNLGWAYNDIGDHEAALAVFRKALALREEQGNIQAIDIARYTLAYTLRQMGHHDAAMAILEPLSAEQIADDRDDGFVFEELGENLLALGRPHDARPHFQKAYDLLKDISWVADDRLARIKRLGT